MSLLNEPRLALIAALQASKAATAKAEEAYKAEVAAIQERCDHWNIAADETYSFYAVHCDDCEKVFLKTTVLNPVERLSVDELRKLHSKRKP